MSDIASGRTRPSRSPLTLAEFDRAAAQLRLPPQQARIVQLLLEGLKDKRIAAAMGLKRATVRTYLARIFAALNVCDRVELVLRVCAIARHPEE